MDEREEEGKMGRVNGGKTLIRVYSVRKKKSIFNQRKTIQERQQSFHLAFPPHLRSMLLPHYG